MNGSSGSAVPRIISIKIPMLWPEKGAYPTNFTAAPLLLKKLLVNVKHEERAKAEGRMLLVLFLGLLLLAPLPSSLLSVTDGSKSAEWSYSRNGSSSFSISPNASSSRSQPLVCCCCCQTIPAEIRAAIANEPRAAASLPKLPVRSLGVEDPPSNRTQSSSKTPRLKQNPQFRLMLVTLTSPTEGRRMEMCPAKQLPQANVARTVLASKIALVLKKRDNRESEEG
mmetsp:Transcript_1612/g.2878  ORF Transcript_1612/g.2878 Transcript_1612/m.2878 type:complete len:225 (+) Transcript_1612:1375-2049(+)